VQIQKLPGLLQILILPIVKIAVALKHLTLVAIYAIKENFLKINLMSLNQILA
jgi:hypothetical protein